jgi:hypothetical protein
LAVVSTAASGSRAAGGGAAGSDAAGSGAAGLEDAADEVGGDDDEKLRGRGAPKKDCIQMERTLWTDFRLADDRSLFFATNSDVQRRLLIRWTGTAKLKADSCKKPEDRALYEGCTKRLQIMETAVKIHRAWTHRSGDPVKAYYQFDVNWKSLLQFAESEPAQTVECVFLFDFRLQTQVCESVYSGSRLNLLGDLRVFPDIGE